MFPTKNTLLSPRPIVYKLFYTLIITETWANTMTKLGYMMKHHRPKTMEQEKAKDAYSEKSKFAKCAIFAETIIQKLFHPKTGPNRL